MTNDPCQALLCDEDLSPVGNSSKHLHLPVASARWISCKGCAQEHVPGVLAQWPRYGYRRLTRDVQRKGIRAGYTRIRRLMAERGIVGRIKTRKVRTTNSRQGYWPYLVAPLEIVRPDQVWIRAIPYVRSGSQVVYLAVIMDVVTRSIGIWDVVLITIGLCMLLTGYWSGACVLPIALTRVSSTPPPPISVWNLWAPRSYGGTWQGLGAWLHRTIHAYDQRGRSRPFG